MSFVVFLRSLLNHLTSGHAEAANFKLRATTILSLNSPYHHHSRNPGSLRTFLAEAGCGRCDRLVSKALRELQGFICGEEEEW